MNHILVTGGTGFVGRSLLLKLVHENYIIRATYNHTNPDDNRFKNTSINWVKYDLSSNNIDYSSLLDRIDIVVHLAAIVHRPELLGNSGLYTKVNTDGTRKLAEQAAKQGIRKFIYLSTVKVLGENTHKENSNIHAFSETDQPSPRDPYGISKHEAENELINICKNSKMDYVIFRPPLIYGPYVKANFLKLIHYVRKGIPLPLASVKNMRSLLYVDNLSDVIIKSFDNELAKNQIYMISDTDISVPDLIKKIANSLQKKERIFHCPLFLLKVLGMLTGKKDMIDRLTESLLVDNSKIRQDLNWCPPVSIEDGLNITIKWMNNS